MALIKCPECKRKISDHCEVCPNCGYPISALGTHADILATKPKSPFFKQVWFWLSIATIILVITLLSILFSNHEVQPKVDETGNPFFIELTDEVYTNANEYLGYYVNIKGQVFQSLGDNGDLKGVQVWLDPNSCEQNLMIHYTTAESFKDGDYISCSGYIKEIHTYSNTYGTELSVPLLYSTDLRSATYIEVMSPATSTITPENLTFEKFGYSITIEKVELAANETRLYLCVSNNGNATLYVDTNSSVIVQDGNQLNSEINFEANYEEVPYSLCKGAAVSGIVTFPVINDREFEYVIDLHSDNNKEYFETVTFHIGKEQAYVYVPEIKPHTVWNFDNLKYETKGYAISIDKIEFYDNETLVFVTAINDGKATLYVDTDSSVIVQNKKQFNTDNTYITDYEELPYKIATEASATGIISFPAVNPTAFKYTIEIHSDDYNEEFQDIVFTLNSKTPYCQNEENEVWRVTAIINKNPYDWETIESSLCKTDPIYIHLMPQGGDSGEKLRIRIKIKAPDGQLISHVYDDFFYANQQATYGWENGLYENPRLGTCGTLTITFYNADTNEKIGEVSVELTN